MSADVVSIDRGRGRELSRCRAVTREGRPCRNHAVGEDGYCGIHARRGGRALGTAGRARPSPGGRSPAGPKGDINGRRPQIAGGVFDRVASFARTRLDGDYKVDDFGFDEHLHGELLVPLFDMLYRHYFRVRTVGMDRVPESGGALLVGNHSGAIALDAVMVQHAVATEHPQRRVVRNIGADLVFRTPFLSHLARKGGAAVACDEDAVELLSRGELVGVYPEGFKGVGKGWQNRYKLQRFGRGGFVETALATRAPIVPVAVVGAEEAYPMIANLKPLARVLGAPYFPITPTFPLLGPLGLLPLPSRWVIEFGEPIVMTDYPEDAAEDAMFVFELADAVRDRVQQMVVENLARRPGPLV